LGDGMQFPTESGFNKRNISIDRMIIMAFAQSIIYQSQLHATIVLIDINQSYPINVMGPVLSNS